MIPLLAAAFAAQRAEEMLLAGGRTGAEADKLLRSVPKRSVIVLIFGPIITKVFLKSCLLLLRKKRAPAGYKLFLLLRIP